MKTSLLIMAAGIGSRFGGGIKQLEPVGANGELIIDYSIHDAIKAGFNKIIFIIRKEIEKDFRERIGDRIEKICAGAGVEICYAFQNINEIPEGFTVPEGRTKPWGTGQAVLAAKDVINEPFVVINADDYYGKECFIKLHDFLESYTHEKSDELCLAGFRLKNTLSDNGAVTRGICKSDENNYLSDIEETHNIVKINHNDTVIAESEGKQIDINSLVSMNMWGLTPEFVQLLEKGFVDFFEDIKNDSSKQLKAEYLLPIFINSLIHKNKVNVKVIETKDKWFGVTYKEDKEYVVRSFRNLIKDDIYNEKLYRDLLIEL